MRYQWGALIAFFPRWVVLLFYRYCYLLWPPARFLFQYVAQTKPPSKQRLVDHLMEGVLRELAEEKSGLLYTYPSQRDP